MKKKQPNDAPQPKQEAAPRKSEIDPVDESSRESFPASDPPSWAPLKAGPPGQESE
ncbi:MAG TPA: hypothetical protein VJR24_17500 [Gemmatimonadaceae bacterium]|nr:hypothetical protein [Gemmatimonadaceae bacterium]